MLFCISRPTAQSFIWISFPRAFVNEWTLRLPGSERHRLPYLVGLWLRFGLGRDIYIFAHTSSSGIFVKVKWVVSAGHTRTNRVSPLVFLNKRNSCLPVRTNLSPHKVLWRCRSIAPHNSSGLHQRLEPCTGMPGPHRRTIGSPCPNTFRTEPIRTRLQSGEEGNT